MSLGDDRLHCLRSSGLRQASDDILQLLGLNVIKRPEKVNVAKRGMENVLHHVAEP